MGVCQSTLCPLDEESVLKNGQNQKTSQRPVAVKTQFSKDHKNDILSPTLTEATTPASQAESLTPMNGPISLASVISSGGAFGQEATPASSGGARQQTQPSVFNFTTGDDFASTIAEEEEEADAPSDEEEANDLTNQGKAGADLILNPPLLAPSPKEVGFLLNSKTRKGSGNGRMLQEFQRLKLQAQMVARKEKSKKKQAKIKSRVEDVKENRGLFDEFQQMQLLHDTANKDKDEEQRGQLPRRSNSFDLQNTNSWYVNFRESLHVKQNIQDDSSCHSGLSLLSKESMEAQRMLYAEKRRQREIRYSARRKKAQEDAASADNTNARLTQSSGHVSPKVCSKNSRDYETYFQNLLEETEMQLMSTPMISPPRLDVLTNESKITLGAYDYGPAVVSSRLGLSREPSVTNMEVEVPSGEKKPLADDTTCSGITDADFESDFRLQRRRRRQPGPKRDDASMASSLVSYGGPSSCFRPVDNKENIRPVGCHPNAAEGEREEPSARVPEATLSRVSDTKCHANRDEHSLKNRIADLEKKMGIAPHQNAISGATSNCDQFVCPDKQTAKETLRVIGVVPKQPGNSFTTSPISTPADLNTSLARNGGMQEHSPELEPMQLQKMFDENETPSYTDVRERIVMGNCNFTRESIAFMTTEDFRRISTDHALVKWNNGSFRVNHNSTDNDDDKHHGNDRISSSSDARQDESFANDIADEVNNVLSRYRRNWGDDAEMLDANELVRNGDYAMFDEDKSFTSAQGKLYLA